METDERLTGFMTPIYISEKAKEFFNEADFGELQENMTERAGLSTLANMGVLLYIYFLENGRVINRDGRITFAVPPLVARYFSQELGGQSEIRYQQIIHLASKMKDHRLDRAHPLLLQEQKLLQAAKDAARAKYHQ